MPISSIQSSTSSSTLLLSQNNNNKSNNISNNQQNNNQNNIFNANANVNVNNKSSNNNIFNNNNNGNKNIFNNSYGNTNISNNSNTANNLFNNLSNNNNNNNSSNNNKNLFLNNNNTTTNNLNNTNNLFKSNNINTTITQPQPFINSNNISQSQREYNQHQFEIRKNLYTFYRMQRQPELIKSICLISQAQQIEYGNLQFSIAYFDRGFGFNYSATTNNTSNNQNNAINNQNSQLSENNQQQMKSFTIKAKLIKEINLSLLEKIFNIRKALSLYQRECYDSVTINQKMKIQLKAVQEAIKRKKYSINEKLNIVKNAQKKHSINNNHKVRSQMQNKQIDQNKKSNQPSDQQSAFPLTKVQANIIQNLQAHIIQQKKIINYIKDDFQQVMKCHN